MKLCKGCNQTKPLSDFHRRGDGHQARCKVCAIGARVEYYKHNRVKEQRRNKAYSDEKDVWFRSLKAHPCTDCGERFHFAAMQWDHLPGHQKDSSVTELRRLSKKRIMAEIAKCELVCANCHAVRTYLRAIGDLDA